MNWGKVGAFIACVSIVALAGNGPVSYYGQLSVSGNQITGANTGAAVQVHGVSLGWSNTGWESADFFNATTVSHMVDDWKAEIVRAPLGYNGGSGGGTIQIQPAMWPVLNRLSVPPLPRMFM
ncbi:MAG TPA: hypothetical protein VLM37_09985 [Fibrobacteraceae bacterium]|nr:hypothetical protein [Fibrobacteraceae bacterium]